MSKSIFKILRPMIITLLIGQCCLTPLFPNNFLPTNVEQSNYRFLQSTETISLANMPGYKSSDFIKIESLTYTQITTIYENIDQYLTENTPPDSDLLGYSATISKIVCIIKFKDSFLRRIT
jgi:hypothetical protein